MTKKTKGKTGRSLCLQDQTTNPFEIKLNKRKHTVLGRNLGIRNLKSERGMPGQSRSKAIEKRRTTLLAEYRQRNKTSQFVDKRLGEYDKRMSVEEKMLQRFTVERQRQHKARHVTFSLEEESNEFGVSLSKRVAVSYATSINDCELSEEDVKQAHFGGFGVSGSNELHRSQKEIMNDVIAKSKKSKFELQTARESLAELTDKLDSEWSTIRNLVQRGDVHLYGAHVTDDYDLTVKQLAVDGRAQPSDRIKTEVDMLTRRSEKQKEYERSKMKRSRIADKIYRSTDALNEELDIVEDVATATATARADSMDTKAHSDIHQASSMSDNSEGTAEREEQTEGNEDESGGSDDEKSEHESEENEGMNKTSDEENKETKDESHDQGEGIDFEISEHDEEKMPCKEETERDIQDANYQRYGVQQLKLTGPDHLQQLIDLLSDKDSREKVKALEVMSRRLSTKKSAENKKKLEGLFTVLVQYIQHLCCAPMTDLHLADLLTQLLCNMSDSVAHVAVLCMADALRQISFSREQLRRPAFLTISQLVVMRLCGLLFSTSDCQHFVVTSAIILLTRSLSQCRVTSCAEAFVGLFTMSVIYEFVSESKKYVPEMPLFLFHLLSLVCRTVPSFLSLGTGHCEVKSWKATPIPLSQIISETLEESGITWLSVLHVSLRLLSAVASLYEHLISYPMMFQCMANLLSNLSSMSLPGAIQEQVALVTGQLKSTVVLLRPVHFQRHRPIPLHLYTPKFEESFLDNRKSQKSLSAQLRVKHRKELRGAVRELRRDASFLSRENLRNQLTRDVERHRRVKALKQMLVTEQHEMKQEKDKKRTC